jgi:hypothetical protein
MLVSIWDAEGEVVEDLNWLEAVECLSVLNIISVSGVGETLFLEVEGGTAEVLCASQEEVEDLILDLRLQAWDMMLRIPAEQSYLWTGKRKSLADSDLVEPVRFFPGRKIQFGSIRGVVRDFWDDDPSPSIRFVGDDGHERIISHLDRDLKTLLLGKKITSVQGYARGGRKMDVPLKIGDNTVEISTEDGGIVVLWHNQQCCERASLADFEGDVEDLVGASVRRLNVGVDKDSNTFYDIRTTNGDLWLRFGNGNDTQYSIAMLIGYRGKFWPHSKKN